jgi:iron complex outermembrane recepter protein
MNPLLPLSRIALAASLCMAALPATADAPLADLSLEDLLSIEVTSVSRKAQRLTDAPAAAFVVTNEDIQRSGATSIPEALRMVPGVEVARLGAGRWAVSARGFNGRFANKLLVLMDGRSVYSPLFSGVFWEAEDTLLEDIERIEVIRGPGAAMWGANAVNGVINIITKRARDTLGGLVTARAGIQERASLSARYGGSAGDGGFFRVWGKTFEHDESSAPGGGNDANDHWKASRAGFRLDKNLAAGSNLTLIGNAYDGKSEDTLLFPSLFAPYQLPTAVSQKNSGANLLGRFDWTLESGSQATLQSYADVTELDILPLTRERRTTFDVDFQHRLQAGTRHDLIWGLGYRWSRDDLSTGNTAASTGISYLTFAPKSRDLSLVSAFVQDEITLIPETWKLMLGAKLEHNSLTGFEPQPSIRLLWTPTSKDSVWAAASRAVRTPSRAERDVQINYTVIPPNPRSPLPVVTPIQPNPNLDSERLTALELGYRAQLTPRLSVDAAAYYNDYDKLRGSVPIGQGLVMGLPPYATFTSQTSNALKARTHGLELAVDWHPTDWWRLQGAYTYQKLNARRNGDIANDDAEAMVEGLSPRHKFSLRSSFNLTPNQQLDVWARRVGGLSYFNIPAYTAVDLRYAWKLDKNLELSLVGQNLFDPRHAESASDFLSTQSVEIMRGGYVQLKWKF